MREEGLVETLTKGNRILKIYQDDDPLNPRTDWDQLGTMVCWYRRYSLGDKHEFKDPEDFHEFCRKKKRSIVAILPLYLLDHSGLRMNIRDFDCYMGFDSGQVGYIYCLLADAKKWYGKALPKDLYERRKKLEEHLISEVKEYDQYLSGDIYRFEVFTLRCCPECGHETHDDEDSCGGFYGTNWKENGLFEHAGWPEEKEEEKKPEGIVT